MSRKLAANGKLGLKKIIVNFADVLLRRNDRIEGIRIGMAIFTQKIIERNCKKYKNRLRKKEPYKASSFFEK